MNWIEITVYVNTEASDAVTERLIQLGAAGMASVNPEEIVSEIIPLLQQDLTTVVDDLDQYTTSDEAEIKTYFLIDDSNMVACNLPSSIGAYSNFNSEAAYANNGAPTDRLPINDFLKRIEAEIEHISQFLEVGDFSVASANIHEADWRDKWKENYQAFQLTDSIFVVPSWDEDFEHSGDYEIRLDPGTAFGTGTHPTTMCSAQLLEKYLRADMEVLDLGTGSGILAIVASLLGSKSVQAVDIDAQAVATAEDNARFNKVADNIVFSVGDIYSLAGDFDLVVANLTANLHQEIFSEYSNKLKPGATLIISGIIADKLDSVLDMVDATQFDLLERIEKEDWNTIAFLFNPA